MLYNEFEYQVMIMLISSIPIFYIAIMLFTYAQRFYRTYTRNQILRFTQTEITSQREKISCLIAPVNNNVTITNKHKQAIQILSIYNEIAIGINEGLYDELYVKMVCGFDMMYYYKFFYDDLFTEAGVAELKSRFLPLELLLKRWDDNKGPVYHQRKGRYR